MARGYEPEEFIGPREVPEEHEHNAHPPSRNDEPHDQGREEREQGTASHTDPGTARSPELRKVTKSGAAPIASGPRKSQRWLKSASSGRLAWRISGNLPCLRQ